MHTVTLVEINVYDDLVPLDSGYLQTYACTSAAVRENYQFRKRSCSRTATQDQICQDLVMLSRPFIYRNTPFDSPTSLPKATLTTAAVPSCASTA